MSMAKLQRSFFQWAKAVNMRSCIVLLLGTLCSLKGFAKELETQESLKQVVYDFLAPQLSEMKASRTEIVVGRIDPRLKLAKCEEPLQVDFLGKKNLFGKVNIRLNCPQPRWGIFIPSQIKVFEYVVISQVSLPRRSVIAASQLALREVETSALNYTFFREIAQVAGTTSTRSIQANHIVYTNMVKASAAIRKGDSLIIKAVAGSLAVRVKGQALQEGAIGEQIQVRNDKSRRIIRAIVVGPGQVEVPM